MSDIMVIIAVMIGWIALQTWVLPRLGVST